MDANCFPRGGAEKKPVIQSRKFCFEKKPPKKKKNTQKTTNNEKPKYFIKIPEVASSSHYHLQSKDLIAGFQTICAVHSILPDFVLVCLPQCSLRAYLPKSQVSNAFNSLSSEEKNRKNLVPMFYKGQLLSCKIIKKPSEVDFNQSKPFKEDIYITTNPSAVNSKLNPGMITRNCGVQMAVSSIEDHGYMLDAGIPGVMAFLPSKEAEKHSRLLGKKTLGVGTILWCLVVKSTVNSTGANVVEVKLPSDEISKTTQKMYSNFIWPGSRVNTTIFEVTDHGCCNISVDGTMINGIVESRIDFLKDPSTQYMEGSSSPATLISFHPQLNLYYFSFSHNLLDATIVKDKKCEKKEKLEAVVDYVSEEFIYLNIAGKNCKGVVVLNASAKIKKEHKEQNEEIAKQYKPGDRVWVNTFALDYFRRAYKCNIVGMIPSAATERQESKKRKNNQNIIDKFLTEDQIKKEVDFDSQIKQEVDSESQADSGIYTKISKKKKKKSKKKKKIVEDDGYCYQNDSDIEMEEDSNIDEIKEEQMSDCQEFDSDIEIKLEENSDIDELQSSVNSKAKNAKHNLNKHTNEATSSSDDSEVEIVSSKTQMSKKRKIESSNVANKKPRNEGNDEKLKLSDVIKKKIEDASKLSLQDVDSQFIWDATPDDLNRITSKDVEDYEEESDEEKVSKKVLTKSQKKANELEKERKIQEKEAELLKAYEDPKSADHYERIILSKPDDSKVWIKYMAFHLEATEIEKAKAVGSRALKLISPRKEQDRINIWLALLNLEHLYGSKESFKETWMEALKCNDDYKINSKVLELYASSQNSIEVNNLVQKMVKQYRENSDCWYLCLSALMTARMEEKAREILQRSLKALPQKSHVTLISRFALLENSNGHTEEAQALFDNLLTSYPSRVDIWFVYLDMLIKSNKTDLARQVFERATNMKLPAKKMKSIYKKWLDFEEKNGSEECVEMVRQSAIKYVEQATKDIDV